MLDKVHDAAMLSVRHVPHDPLGTSILNQFDRKYKITFYYDYLVCFVVFLNPY